MHVLYFPAGPLEFTSEVPLYWQDLVSWAPHCLLCGFEGCVLAQTIEQHLGDNSHVYLCIDILLGCLAIQ